ncbi:hypothetical protein PR202_gb03356 [Eleusine coracana subsp. coracana]|uniref:YDG domain-containing protein n=1 Tax=Eleusine coracana subsp. coracana TaxID=191504 RepID=A0AAV5E1K7_ELECO|nr:hypothetical protein PR202_gb03356 [Eleusine coracana subsp. coracana]
MRSHENTLQSGEKNPSRVLNKSGGSSCNVVAKSSSQGPSKEFLNGKRLSEIGRMNRVSSDVPARMSSQSTMTRNKIVRAPEKAPMEQKNELATNKAPFGPKKMGRVECPDHPRIKVVYAWGSKENFDTKAAFNLKDDDVLKAATFCQEELKLVLVQDVEQRLLILDRGRIDTIAYRAMKKLPDFSKPDPIVGKVPGVEVGDEFLYRVQLATVGLVRELIYTGSGGKLAGKEHDEDQQLEGGNLALENSIITKNPVRVIYGFESHNVEGHSYSRAKKFSMYTYDGLYQVVDSCEEGEPGSMMLKYILKKIPGQPELPLHIAKRMWKSKKRRGLRKVDISERKEGKSICVMNTVDDVRPAPFKYITRIISALRPTEVRPQGCGCTNGCSDSGSCSCARKNGGKFPFNSNGAIVSESPLIYECGPSYLGHEVNGWRKLKCCHCGSQQCCRRLY